MRHQVQIVLGREIGVCVIAQDDFPEEEFGRLIRGGAAAGGGFGYDDSGWGWESRLYDWDICAAPERPDAEDEDEDEKEDN